MKLPCSNTSSDIPSSSPKSMRASTSEVALIILTLIAVYLRAFDPYADSEDQSFPWRRISLVQSIERQLTEDCRAARILCPSLPASTRSLIPSTWVKSILPASKANRVNSPGSATRQPDALYTPVLSRFMSSATRAGEPCKCSSREGRLVKD